MPLAAAVAVRCAFLHLLAASALGTWVLAARGLALPVPPPGMRGAHAELALVGWTIQLALGVAWWILPKHRTGRPRGAAALPMAAWLGLNAGVLAVVLGHLLDARPLVAAGRAAEFAAVGTVVVLLLPRVKAFAR